MARGRRAAALTASLAAVALGQEVPGCFYHPFAAPTLTDPYAHGIYRYLDPTVSAPAATAVPSAEECQVLCQKEPTCSVFTYFPNTRACWLQTAAATLNVTLGVFYGGETTAGPKFCEEVPPRCRAVVDHGFPGTLQQAFPTEYQPRKGVCFKKTDRTGSFPTYDTCTPTRVVQQITRCGWGPVVGIPMSTLEVQKRTCRNACEENPDCAAYEVIDGLCYTGIGENCTLVPAGQTASGERIVRGSTRVMYSWSGNRFVAGAAMREGFVPVQQFKKMLDIAQIGSLKAAEQACRELCTSYLHCEFWQLDSEAGCYIDTSGPNTGLAYPLVADNFKQDVPTVVAGEYVQHLCSGAAAVTTPAPNANPPLKARITLELVNLSYAAIPAPKLPALRSKYAHEIAIWLGVPDASVQAMDGTQGVTLAAVPWTVNGDNSRFRRLQAAAVSSWLDARVAAPAGQTAELLVSRVVNNQKMFDALEDATRQVLGADSAAFRGTLDVVPRMEVFQSATAQRSKESGRPWWIWLVVAMAVALAVAGIAVAASLACGKKKKVLTKKRRNKSAAINEGEETEEGHGAAVTPLMAGAERNNGASPARHS